MRTTLSIDDDVMQAARQLARARSCSLGAILSDLARQSLREPGPPCAERNGFALFQVADDAPIVTAAEIARAEEAEDERDAMHLARR